MKAIISVCSGDVGGSENKIVHWYEALKKSITVLQRIICGF